MLNERQIMLVVRSAMSKYAADNDGKKGLAKKEIITYVAKYSGDTEDVQMAMIEGIKLIAPEHRYTIN